MRCALVGDQLAELAVKKRLGRHPRLRLHPRLRAIGEMDIGVFALGTHPKKSVKRNVGEADIPVSFGGVTFSPASGSTPTRMAWS
jgi:regulator of ribonuclease activity A